jgi:DNA-binding CsgD family transcriptional regulator
VVRRLTVREQQVLILTAFGCTASLTAMRLRMKTVSAVWGYRGRIGRKLEITCNYEEAREVLGLPRRDRERRRRPSPSE